MGLARQSTMVLTKRPMLSCDNAGLDGRARWACGQERGHALSVSTHDVLVDRPHAPPVARLHHVGIAQRVVGNAPWMGVGAPRATPWRLIPCSRYMPHGSMVCRQVITGQKGEQVRGDMRDPLPQQMGCSWRARADDTGHNPAPLGRTGPPAPGIAIGVTRGLRPRERRVLRRDNTPPLGHLTRSAGELWPPVQGHKPTLPGGPIEPWTHGILIHLHDPRRRPDRIALRQGANGQFTQCRVMLHIARGGSGRQGDAMPTRATHGLALAPRGPMRDHPALVKAHAVKRTARIGTIEGFPVPMILG